MYRLIKNNLEIFIAIIFIILIAGGILGGDKISQLWKGGSLQFDEEELIELIKDRPEAQRKVFIQRIEVAKELLEQNPEDPAAFEIIGFLYDTSGDKKTAKEYYKGVLEFNPESVAALNNLANIYSGEEKFKKAEALYLRIAEVDASIIETWRDLHDLYRYLYKEKEDQADDILLLGLEKNPADAQILVMLAVYYQDTGNTGKAIEYYVQLLDVMPENEAARRELNKLLGN